MASRNTNTKKTYGINIKDVHILIPTNGASNPASFVDPGNTVESVTYASGQYTITLKDVYQNLVGFQCTMMAAADDLDMYAQAGDYDLAAKTFIVRFKTGAIDTQPPAANANNQLSVTLTFADSRVL